jgi:hypothetical protein
VLGCSNTNNVCLFDVEKGILLRKFKLSDNVEVLGVPTWREAEELQRRNKTKHVRRSKTEQVQQHARKEGYEAEDALEKLPGVSHGKYGQGQEEQRIGATAIAFSPTDRQWSVCSSVGYAMLSSSQHDFCFIFLAMCLLFLCFWYGRDLLRLLVTL